jgi:hypothetical protein
VSRYILFTMILPKRQSSKPISLQFSESNEYMFGGIHDNTGSQVTIREWPSKSVQSGRGGQNRGSFQADASKVPGCRNAKDVRPSPITTLRLWGTTLLCLLASTTTSHHAYHQEGPHRPRAQEGRRRRHSCPGSQERHSRQGR